MTERLQLTLFGPFHGHVGANGPLALPTRKCHALLAYLALPPGRTHTREKLASLLWGDLPDRQARGGLRQALSALRKVGADPALLIVDGDSVAIDRESVDVDAIEFERCVADGTPAALGKALALYRGELLEGLSLREPAFEGWLLAEREQFRERALQASARLLRLQRDAGAFDDAISTALRLLALDPLQEPVHRVLMRLYIDRGRRAAALRQYQVCVSALARELRVEPEPATKLLYADILRQRPSTVSADAEGAEITESRLHADDDTLPRDIPLIGRDAEHQRVVDVLEREWTSGARVIAVFGEAGVGKSRFLAEVAADASARRGRVLVGRCHEAEQILPFGPWVDALRAATLTAIDAAVANLAPSHRAAIGRLLPELSTSDAGEPTDHRQIFEAVSEILVSVAARVPLMIILEDVHWADESSLRLLSYLGRRLRDRSLVIVCTARLERLTDAVMLRRTFDDLGDRLIRVTLAPLSRTDTLRLARIVAQGSVEHDVLSGLFDQIWTVSEGNPLVVVEAIRALPDRGETARSISVPQRVRDVIAHHIETLSEGARDLAAVAAVIGHDFEFRLLHHAASLEEGAVAQRVEELVRCRVLQHVGETFEFTHERIREVAYDRILPERRRALHARIASAIDELYADRLSDHIERLAHHATLAQMRDRGIAALRQAGSKAFSNSAPVEAVANFSRALDLISGMPAGIDRDRLELGVRLALGPTLQVTRGHAAPDVEANYQRARELATAVGDLTEQFQAQWGLWLMASHRASGTTALELGGELLALAERSGDSALTLEGHHALWPVLIWLGHVDAARPHLERGIALYDPAKHRGHAFVYGGHDPGMCALKCASWAFWLLGHPERALDCSARSLRLAETLSHPPSLVLALVWACIFRDLRRETDAAHAHARELITIATEQGMAQWRATGIIVDASARAELGDGASAVSDIMHGIDVYTSTGAGLFVPYFESLLARAQMRTGQSDRALDTITRALTRAQTTNERVWEPELLRLEGELRLIAQPTDPGPAVECFGRAIEVAQHARARSWELRAAASLTHVLIRNGDRERARRALADVYATFSEGFDTADLRQAQTLLNDLATA